MGRGGVDGNIETIEGMSFEWGSGDIFGPLRVGVQ